MVFLNFRQGIILVWFGSPVYQHKEMFKHVMLLPLYPMDQDLFAESNFETTFYIFFYIFIYFHNLLRKSFEITLSILPDLWQSKNSKKSTKLLTFFAVFGIVATSIKILLLLQNVGPGNGRVTGTLGPYLELPINQ